MLAHKYLGQELDYPVLVQPKLDGIRCIAIIKDGNVTLLSRTGKEILSLPTLVESLKLRYNNICLDGELMVPGAKFEEICEIVKRKKLHKDEPSVEFRIFDTISSELLEVRLSSIIPQDYVGHVIVQNIAELELVMEHYLNLGSEGAMIRQLKSYYTHKRDNCLLKWKKFNEVGGKILDIEAGSGKFENLAAIAWVETEDDMVVKVKFRFAYSILSEILANKAAYIDKHVDIKYQNRTKYGMYRFPEIIRIREDL
jgi:DNA ligase-1